MSAHIGRRPTYGTISNGRVPDAPNPDEFFAEDPSLAIRLIVASCVGVFARMRDLETGAHRRPVRAGQVVGTIDCLTQQVLVVCPFAGTLMGMMADSGERVRPGQPLAWVAL